MAKFDYKKFIFKKTKDTENRELLKNVYYKGGFGYATDAFVAVKHLEGIDEREGKTYTVEGIESELKYPDVTRFFEDNRYQNKLKFDINDFTVEKGWKKKYTNQNVVKLEGNNFVKFLTYSHYVKLCEWIKMLGIKNDIDAYIGEYMVKFEKYDLKVKEFTDYIIVMTYKDEADLKYRLNEPIIIKEIKYKD